MTIGVHRVRALLEVARAARAPIMSKRVPNQRLRELYLRWRTLDVHNTASLLADRAGYRCPMHVERLLGLRPMPARMAKGRAYPARTAISIKREAADRLLAGMGLGPGEIEPPDEGRA
jgi:hypothetical protein